jgi:hypothetical protein
MKEILENLLEFLKNLEPYFFFLSLDRSARQAASIGLRRGFKSELGRLQPDGMCFKIHCKNSFLPALSKSKFNSTSKFQVSDKFQVSKFSRQVSKFQV